MTNTLIRLTAYLLLGFYLLMFVHPESALALLRWLREQWRRVPVGTKSILCGAHAFWFHPFVVALAWWKTYGVPLDPRLWVAFFVHDLGYIGCPNMDGKEGEKHPELGARIMAMFPGSAKAIWPLDWSSFSLYHSRTYAKLYGAEVSKLCYADKLAFTVQSKRIYLFLVKLTGEYHEYLDNARRYNAELGYTKIRVDTLSHWYDDLVKHFYSVIKPT